MVVENPRFTQQWFGLLAHCDQSSVTYNSRHSKNMLPVYIAILIHAAQHLRIFFSILIFVFLSGCFLSASANADTGNIARIWALDDGEKVRKTDLNFPLANSPDNPVWDGSTIRIFGAKNEVVAFQVFLEATSKGASGLSVTLPSLNKGSTTIANSGGDNPFDYVGKHIEIFTEHYIHVTSRTEASFIWSSGAKPMDIYGKEYTGWIPDALIPSSAPAGLGGFPFRIAANTLQGIWIDITIPKNIPGGVYTGTLSILQNGNSIKSIPVNLTVYNFTLPDDTHMKNFFYLDKELIARKHNVPVGSAKYYEIEKRYLQMFHRHRMDLNPNMDLNTLKTKYKDYFTGKAYNAANGYEGPGAGQGQGTYAIGVYDQPKGRESGFTATKATWTAQRDAWTKWFDQNAPKTEIFKYMIDEPIAQYGGGKYLTQLQQAANWLHNGTGPSQSNYLMAYCTSGGVDGYYYTALKGYVDFWAITGQSGFKDQYGGITGYDSAHVQLIHKNGGKVAWYNGTRPSSGATVLDTDAVDFRSFSWIAWKYKLDQYFLWYTDHWYSGSLKQDPFVEIWTRPESTGDEKRWGNGVIVYPGEEYEFPVDNRGLKGPIASIRMKNWRRGAQDYEYLWLAQRAGLASQVTQAVNTVIPAAMDEVDQQKQAPWASRGFQYEQQRKNLGASLSDYYSRKAAPSAWNLYIPTTINGPDSGLNPKGIIDHRR